MANLHIFDDITLSLTTEQMVEALHLSDPDDITLMDEKRKQALAIARPKALYTLRHVDGIEGEEIHIAPYTFASQILAEKLAGVHMVFPFVVTCGTEVDDWSHQEEDYFLQLWLDMIKELLLGQARRQFYSYIKERYHIPAVASMSPGSGNLDTWPIAQQRPLFDLLGGVTDQIGVELTEGYLMLPTKSVSGILFPSDSEFITCSLCRRENCPNRRAAYRPPVG